VGSNDIQDFSLFHRSFSYTNDFRNHIDSLIRVLT
jgi:hypothetical protein